MARASLEELRLDYEDFLRQRKLSQWGRNDSRREELIARRPGSADDVARWARDVRGRGWDGASGQSGRCGQGGQGGQEKGLAMPAQATYAEIAANGALALIAVACSLLDRQMASLDKAFAAEGGFTERLYRVRSERRIFRPQR